MSDPNLYRLRVTYKISDRLAMLSHLETVHALDKTVRRAGLPYAISQGFSPHMKTSYGSALPVGVGGEAELFEVLLTKYINPKFALEKLQEVSCQGLMPYHACYVEHSAPAISVAFPRSLYKVSFTTPISHLKFPERITLMKKGKPKEMEVSQFISEAPKFSDGHLMLTLITKDTGSMRPDILVQNAVEYSIAQNIISSETCIASITRIEQTIC